MGLWKRIKNAAKAVARAVRGAVRCVIRVVLEVVHRIINFVAAIVNYGGERRMRLHIVILRDPVTKLPLVTTTEAEASFQRTVKILKASANVRVSGYIKAYVTELQEDAPQAALNVVSGIGGYFKTEFGEAGAFFSNWLAGWNATPVTFKYPITVFVVQTVTESPSGDVKSGASFGPLADYVVLTQDGIRSDSTMAHELGHSCLMTPFHRDNSFNLMYPSSWDVTNNRARGTALTGWQKFWFRSSRFVNVY